MSNFNDYFKSAGLKRIVDKFITDADIYNPDYKITKLSYKILDDPGYPASYYFENDLTSEFKILVEYELNNSGDTLEAEFSVPKELDGTFIINGTYRISTSKLGKDLECRIYNQGGGARQVIFDYFRYYNIDDKELVIKNIDPNLGISDKNLNIPYNEINSSLEGEKKEALKLTEKQSKKFQIKLDLDEYPEYITQELIDKCIELGDDRVHDFIIDKTIDSVPTSFMNFLFKSDNGANFYSVRKKIRSYFIKYNKLNLNSITSLCNRYFRLGSAELQIPPGVNPINLDSFKSKIQLNPSVAYNTTMTDLIDIADTPINNNTNLQNSLTVSCHISDDGNILFDVYDKDFKKITIQYYDYLNSKVVASEYVDYDTNTLKPNENNQVEVKFRMKRRMVDVSEIDLIDLHPDYRLSSTSRRIPFINYTDSVRVSMGTSMLKQSVFLINNEKPLVDTGNNEELEENVLNEKFTGTSGTVTDITESDVIIRLDDTGNEVKYPRKTAIKSIHDISVYTEPKVKIGQKVKTGDIILGGVGIEKDTVKPGLNTNVLYHAYKGLVNEDAVVVSEAYADRMAHYSVIDLSIDIRTNSSLKWILPIGTKVKSKDPVVMTYKAVKLNEINRLMNERLGSLLGSDLSNYTEEYNLIVPNNIDYATVSDVKIVKNTNPEIPKKVKAPDYSFSEASQPIIDEYEKTFDRSIIYENFPEYIASDRIRDFVIDSKSYKVVYTIEVRLIQYNRLKIGDKLTNRYGGKGVISKVVPTEKMPIVNGRRIEVVLNPYSTIGRKIPSVIMEVALSNIAIKLYDLVEDLKRTKTGQKKILPLVNKYYNNKYGDDLDSFLKLHSEKGLELYSFNVGSYSKFTPDLLKQWMTELGVSTQSKVLMPKEELTDLDELKRELPEDEYNSIVESMKGQFEEVDKPLMTGNMTMVKLYHCPEYSNKVTTDMTDVKFNDPLMGRGRYRREGQKIGEMELAALLARKANKFVDASRAESAKVDNQLFLNNLLGLGMRVVDDSGYNIGGGNLKTSINKMKNKYKVK